MFKLSAHAPRCAEAKKAPKTTKESMRRTHGYTAHGIWRRFIPIAAAFLAWGHPVYGAAAASEFEAQKTRQAVVTRINTPIVLDGVLDEPDWMRAPSIGDLVQREPRSGATATERTIVKLLSDRDNLYIGITAYDSAPQQIVATQMKRDGDSTTDNPLLADDRIEILLDTFHDRRNAFYFATNPLGALVDGLIIENSELNTDFDAIWDVRTHRFSGGWTAEFAIPFKSLGFRKGETAWGFNISRTIKRKLEEDRWASPRLETEFVQVSEAGTISGLGNAEQGLGLDVRPFLASSIRHDFKAENTGLTVKPGLDVFYNITPSLKLTGTLNTDFGETEVDARQINLTRFPLFFPEKRSFFLEDAGVFTFSNTGNDILPFFSRRIGILPGEQVPILAGAKLTGKSGEYDIGVLGVRTEETGLVPGKTFFVARVRRNFFAQSYIGAIVTHGDPALDTSATTLGADLHLATANLLGRPQNFQVDSFWLKSLNEGVDGKDSAFGFSASYPNDLVSASVDWREIQENFRPALGFVSRGNVRRLRIAAEFDPRPADFLNIRQMFHEFSFTRYVRIDKKRVESWRIFAAPINWTFNSGDRIEFNYIPQFERLFEPFEISPGVVLPPGDYPFTQFRAEFGTASKRRWQIASSVYFGEYWSGNATEVELTIRYKLPPHLDLSIETDQTFARLPQGDFTTRLFTLRADYSFTPYLTLSNLAQFDNDSRDLGWQSRLRWIIQPGNELFVVFNQDFQQDPQGGFRFSPASTKLATKFQYTFRF